MRTVSAALKAHLAQKVTTAAICMRVDRLSAISQGYTTCDVPLTFEGVTYDPMYGVDPSALAQAVGIQVNNMDARGFLNDSMISAAGITAGQYDNASIEVFLVNYMDLSMGKLILETGTIGEISTDDDQFRIEVSGLEAAFNRDSGELYSATCRVKRLGDARCKVSLAPFTHNSAVTAVTDNYQFRHATSLQANGYFKYGILTWNTGANAGIESVVKESLATGDITLRDPTPFAITVGDNFAAIRGCDRTAGTCINVYNNIKNYRGEPHLPGVDRMLESPV